METLSYLLKVNICWASFYACYWLLFRKQTFFAWNRIYLLGSLLTGMLIPGIKFHQKVTLFVENQLSAPTYNVIPAHANIENQHSIWEAAIVISYLTGVLIMLAFFVKSLIQIYRIIKKGSVVERNDCRLIVYPGQAGSGSFSFLKWIVMPDQDFENHFNTIFSHEIVHIRQWHSLDILLIEILKVFFWFNPFLWFYKNSLQKTHEFLADREAPDKDNYASFLVSYARQGITTSLSNRFFNKSILKQRIYMIYKKRSAPRSRAKYLLTLPLLAAAVLLMAGRTYDYSSAVKNQVERIDNPAVRKNKRTANVSKLLESHSAETTLTIGENVNNYQQVPVRSGSKKSASTLAGISNSNNQNKADSLIEFNKLLSDMTAAMERNDLENADKIKNALSIKFGWESIRFRREQTELRLRSETFANQNTSKSLDLMNKTVLESAKDEFQIRLQRFENLRQKFEETAKSLRQQLGQATSDTEKSTQEHIIADLIAEGVISNGENLSYRLHNMFLIVNGVEQPESLHQKLKSKYLRFSWTEWVYNWDGATGYRFTGVRFNG